MKNTYNWCQKKREILTVIIANLKILKQILINNSLKLEQLMKCKLIKIIVS